MRILSPPRRTTITGATFSRNSEAIDSLGRIALPGLPRLEYVDGVGWVTWVEEATSNLIINPDCEFNKPKLNGYGYDAYLISVSSTDYYNFGSKSLKLTTGTTSFSNRYYQMGETTSLNTLTAGLVYTFSAWVYVPSTSGITLSNIYLNAVYYVSSYTESKSLSPTAFDTWQKLVVTITIPSGATQCFMRINIAQNIQNVSIYADDLKLSQKAYPTSFCMPDSPRAAEPLTMPTAGLSVSEGTIEGVVEITDVVKRIGVGSFANIFSIFKTDSTSDLAMRLNHDSASSLWYLRTYNDAGVATQVSIADSLTPNDFYYYKIPWAVIEAKIELWNLSTCTKVATGTISTPNLPSGFNIYGYMGSLTGYNFANTRFGKHRLSDIARTADPDFDNLMPNDANTVQLFDPTPIYNQNVR